MHDDSEVYAASGRADDWKKLMFDGRWLGHVDASYGDDQLIVHPGLGYPELRHLQDQVFSSMAALMAELEAIYRNKAACAALSTLLDAGMALYAAEDGTLYDSYAVPGSVTVQQYYDAIRPLLRRYASELWHLTRTLGAEITPGLDSPLGRHFHKAVRHLGSPHEPYAKTFRHAVDVPAPCGHLLRDQMAAPRGERWCLECAREARPL